ncbi:hypothetical protein QBC35DRAFT_396889, partial [Podospora australis]
MYVNDLSTNSGWKMWFESAWPSFRSKFRQILDSLKRYRALLSEEKLTVVIEEQQTARHLSETKHDEISKYLQDKFDTLKNAIKNQELESQNSLRSHRKSIRDRLNAPDYEMDHQLAAQKRHRKSSGNWSTDDPRFQQWLDGAPQQNDTLYLHGSPGSGKTTLVSQIIDHLRMQQSKSTGRLVFFYFKHGSDFTKNSMSAMLRALLAQLLFQDDDLVSYLHQNIAEVNDSESLSQETLQSLTETSLQKQPKVLVILDGLDESGVDMDIQGKVAHDIIKWFEDLMKHPTPGCSCTSNIKLLIAAQRDGSIDCLLSTFSQIRLENNPSHEQEIRWYARTVA